MPIINKLVRANKQNEFVRIVRYLGRDNETRIITETTDGTIRRCRGSDLPVFFMS